MPYPPRAHSAAHPARAFLVAALALAAALAPARGQRPAASAGEVRLFVTVTDGEGRYLSGLDRSHFSVLEGKEARRITAFESADRPASVGVLVDVSGPMNRHVENIKLALGRLALRSHRENQYFIAEFNTQGRMLTDWTSDAARLEGAILGIGAAAGASGNTSLYDACAGALAKLEGGAHAKRVLVVVSDGRDTQSRTSFRDLLRQSQSSDVLLYVLGMKERSNIGAPDAVAEGILTELAVLTGGAALFPENRRAAAGAGEWIAVDLRNKYVVGFAPGAGVAGAGAPKWRKIKIKVSAPSEEVKGVRARSREGYLFPRAGG